MVQMQDAVQHWDPSRTLVMGSSLGGFYATWLAAWFGCHAVLLNPAVHPARDLQHHFGVHPVWHDPSQTIEIKQSDIDALWPFYCGKGLQWVPAEKRMASQLQHDSPNLMAWVATGDEVLDWQEMAWRYSESHTHIIQGSDHGLSDIADHVHLLAAWLNPR